MLEKPKLYEDLDYDIPVPRSTKFKKKLQAKALYDNSPDTPDELAFKKGDILTVIEQDPVGLDGWWQCILNGRQGLCPGNRLRILNSYDSGCFSLSPTSSICTSLTASTATLNSSICSTEVYENSNAELHENSYSSPKSASQTQLNHSPQLTLQPISNVQQQLLLRRQQGTRRSWHASNKANTPTKYGDVNSYHSNVLHSPTSYTSSTSLQNRPLPHLPSNTQIYSNQSIYENHSMMSSTSTLASNGSSNNEFATYDIPKPATPVNYDSPKNILCRTPTLQQPQLRYDAMRGSCSTPIEEEDYDVPRPLHQTASLLHRQNTLTPSSSNSSLITSDSMSLSFSSSNRSSLANMPDYDIPRRNPLPVRAAAQIAAALQIERQQQQQQHQQQPKLNTNCMTYDFPLPSPQEKQAPNVVEITAKELPLELNSALETMDKLQVETTAAITRLLSFVSPEWRLLSNLESMIMDVKLTIVRLRTALHDLTEFAEGTYGNATRSEDLTLAKKLKPLVRALRDANNLIHESSDVLDAQGWVPQNLAKEAQSANKSPDSLDQLIACSQTLTEDVRQTTSFIQGNALLLFKPNQVTDSSDVTDSANGIANGAEKRNTASGEWLEDYDYVSFESKDAAAKKNSDLREAIPTNLKQKFDNVIKTAENNVMEAALSTSTSSSSEQLTTKDKTVIRFYARQIITHMGHLKQAIDSFLETVAKNQPPKFFIAYGKFVVVSAHNLVTIGDIVHRNVSQIELRERILRCSNALSDALKVCVTKSKKAAAYFPSVSAVQEMVDAVENVRQLAIDLKVGMLYAVQLTL